LETKRKREKRKKKGKSIMSGPVNSKSTSSLSKSTSGLLKKGMTFELEDTPAPGEGKVRRSVFATEGLVAADFFGCKTLYECFKRGVENNGDKPCFGRRLIQDGKAGAYVWETFNQIQSRVMALGSFFVKRELPRGGNVGIFSVNRPEWVISEQACNAFGYVTVPLYDTLGPEAIEFIITQTEMSTIVLSNDKFDLLLREKKSFPTVNLLVLMGGASVEEKEKGKIAEMEVISFAEAEAEGRLKLADPNPSGPNEVVTIMYTSGTTGLPKGVMLSSSNLISVVHGVYKMGEEKVLFSMERDDIHLSYLPLAHVFERANMLYATSVGGPVGFYQGNPAKLLDDIATLQPTIFISVPRLLNRIYDKITAAIDLKGGLSAQLFHAAVRAKRAGLKSGSLTHWLWDKLVFNKVKARLGGRVKCIVTGSAPLSPEVMDFLRLAFCCEVFEGYGQTESSGAVTVTLAGDYESGHIGVPLPAVEVKLVDVPEMNYTSNDKPYPRGEICLRGPTVFLGYYKSEEKTKEAIDSNGWLHSGDVGMWDEKGRLRIIDRKKNIFKLAQGEYIAPEKVENVYQKSKWVAQVFVYGDSLKAFLIAIVVPDEENLTIWAKENNIGDDWINLPQTKELIFNDMIKTGKQLGLKSFEQVKAIYLDSRVFTVENNLLTPTFKLKRPQAKEYYQEIINQLIADVDKAESEKERKAIAEEEKKK